MHLSINVPFNLYFNVFVRLYVSCVLTTSSMNSKYYANVFHLGILANVSHSSNVNEVIKTILDFFIQKNSILNGPKKLVFVRMYGSTIIGLVGPPYSYCSLVAFCAFAWLRVCAFGAFGASKIFS